MLPSVHTPYLAAEEKCNEVMLSFSLGPIINLECTNWSSSRNAFQIKPHSSPPTHPLKIQNFHSFNKHLLKVGGYLADVLDADENNFIKSVLNVINPKVTTSTNTLLDVGIQDISYDVGRNWLLARWPGRWSWQGTPMDVRCSDSSICPKNALKIFTLNTIL